MQLELSISISAMVPRRGGLINSRYRANVKGPFLGAPSLRLAGTPIIRIHQVLHKSLILVFDNFVKLKSVVRSELVLQRIV